MTPEQALQILDAMAQPVNAGKANRQDYVMAQKAVEVLTELIKANSNATAAAPK